MLFGIQILGVVFAVFMLYMTYQNYKRKTFDKRGLVFWLILWLGVILIAALPSTLYGIMETLSIERTADLIMVGGFIFFAATTFYLYSTTKKLDNKLEKLVRNMAIEEQEQKDKQQKNAKKQTQKKK